MRFSFKATLFITIFGLFQSGFGQQICKYNHDNQIVTSNSAKVQFATDGHIALMNRYDLRFAHLNITVGNTTTNLIANTLLRATALQPLDTVAFELTAELAIDSVLVNGLKQPFYRSYDEVGVLLGVPVQVGQNIDIQVFYAGYPSREIGIFNKTSPTWGNQVTYTLSQPYGALEWWPCKQILHDKLDSVYVFITTSSTSKAGSNGVLTATVPLPNNQIRYEWKCRHPINYYLVSFAAAQYVEYNQKVKLPDYPDSVLIQNFIYDNPQTLLQFKSEIDKTPAMLQYLSDILGNYPFADEKYGHKMAPISGGMEHQTMTTLGYFDAELVAHELGHQWFGNHVTCASWLDLWLNEGFASYIEILYNELFEPQNLPTKLDDVFNNVISKPNGSVYVTDTTDQSRLFSPRLTYNKAAAVIHTLRFMINHDSLFFAILKNYQQQFSNSVATTEDFATLVTQLTGKNWQAFFQQWVYGEGFPNYSGRWNSVSDTLWIEIAHYGSAGNPSYFDTDLELQLNRAAPQADTTIRIHHGAAPSTTIKIPFSGTVTSISTDPKQWILDQNDGFYLDPAFGVTSREPDNWINWRILPNPASQYCAVELTQLKPETYVTLRDLNGNEIKKVLVNELRTIINLENLTSGVYFVEVRNPSYIKTQKLCIIR